MTTPRKRAKRAAAMRRAFVRRFGGDAGHDLCPLDPLWLAWQAGAQWQRRQVKITVSTKTRLRRIFGRKGAAWQRRQKGRP